MHWTLQPTRSKSRIFAGALGVVLIGCMSRTNKTNPAASSNAVLHPAPTAMSVVATRVAEVAPHGSETHGPLHYLLVGGGATPESTEVSIEQDIDLVRRTLPPPGGVLFAGGTDSESVRELDAAPRGDTVMLALGDLFHPRSGRGSHYRKPVFQAERANVENVERKLSTLLDDSHSPLLLYVAAHGDKGDTPRDNSIALWGGRPLTVARLAELHEGHPRALHMVATSCFSGGFAELAFAHADEHAGPSKVPRCGLFAGTWDRETSGCDANPDRRAQESYGLHFIHALGKTDRAGKPLAPELIDFDHDGVVSLLEAHTRARIAAASLDVPTTTSERWLRSVEAGTAPIDRKLLPEDAAVTDQLGEALGLRDEGAVEARWKALEKKLDDLNDSMDDAEDGLDDANANLGSRLLERWPMLDDPFHPDFGNALRMDRDAIDDVLTHSPEATERTEAQGEVDRVDERLSSLEVEEARVLRLRRAYETLHRAAALMRRGGKAARYYMELLTCERSQP
jgi:hypothetical protein